jgi:hypothetical protein
MHVQTIYRSLAEVPKRGTQYLQLFTPQFATIAPQSEKASQGIMDGTGQYSYRFGNAPTTESCRVKVGPSLLFAAWGKEPN